MENASSERNPDGQGWQTLQVDERQVAVRVSLDSVGSFVVSDSGGVRGVGETSSDAIDAAIQSIRDDTFSEGAQFEDDESD